jgi:hypothetical protein
MMERFRMGVPVPPHGKLKPLRRPSSALGPDALAVQRSGKVCICRDTRQAQFVQHEADIRGG